MAVTKQTYTATATWTASGLAGIFETAFIDAGLMTAWFDSFLSGTIENRILRVINDNSKTYGTVYYWFMFTTSGVFLHTALDWNASTHVPTGTQYLDYFATTTNATTNHRRLADTNFSASTTVTLTRYTSAVDTDVSWFLVRNGSINRAFFIPSAGFNASSFVDQNKVAYNGVTAVVSGASLNMSILDFKHFGGHTRRTYLGAAALRANITSSEYIDLASLQRISVVGNASGSSSNLSVDGTDASGLVLPVALTNAQSGLVSNHNPIFTGPPTSPYMASMPSDFGVAGYFDSNSMAVQDKLIVSSGTEEWEMLAVALNAITDAGKVLFLARVV
jgi:hypothetical protein